jgi:hypothetical protein
MKYPKRARDTAQLAAQIVGIATHDEPNVRPVSNRAATKRGKARAKALSKEKRVAIAKKAAAARWKGSKKD